MTEPNTEQLKSCPFCGSTNIAVNGIVNSHRYMQCGDCLAHGPADTYSLEGIRNKWQERIIEDALQTTCDIFRTERNLYQSQLTASQARVAELEKQIENCRCNIDTLDVDKYYMDNENDDASPCG